MRRTFTLNSLVAGCMLLFSADAEAQNLVPNPGWEVQDTCPAVSEIYLAPPWVSATLGTPDLFNSTCSQQNSQARTGIGSSGVYVYSTFPNNREYMIAPLTSPLMAGTTYYVSFWVKRVNFRYAVNRIGAYFSQSNISQNTTSVLNYTPQVQNPSTTVLNSSTWMQITGSFVAAGGESYVVLGNFSDDANTDTTVANASSTSKVAYYNFDDISVTASGTGIEDNLVSQVGVYPTPASEKVYVTLGPGMSVESIRLFDITGKEMKYVAAEMNERGEVELATSHYPTGIYFVRIQANNTVISKKITVAH